MGTGPARPASRVAFDWGHAGLAAALRTAGDRPVVVVVDVLSFSTAVVVACEAGVPVRPVAPGEPVELDGGILAGARGSGVSLSPRSLTALPDGTRVVLPSPNGGALSAAAAAAGAVVIAGAIRNARAAADAVHRILASDAQRTALVLAAGERWPDGSLRPALEDHVGAGRVLAGLPEAWLTPEATAAATLARAVDPVLLPACASARELTGLGFDDDVALALEADAAAVVPVLEDGWFQAVEGPVCPPRG